MKTCTCGHTEVQHYQISAAGMSTRCQVCPCERFKARPPGQMDWLKDHTILLTAAGSRSYGTNRPDSDVDVKGVTVPPRGYRDGFLHHFSQADGKEHLQQFIENLTDEESRAIAKRDGLDGVVFGLPKFMKLAADCNPNVVEALFVADQDVLICTKHGELLREARKEFLSRKALYTFRGYAVAQLKRIKTHRRWLLNPPAAPPTRGDFGLPEHTVIPADQLAAARASITKRLDGWEIDFHGLDEAEKIHVQEQIQDYLVEVSIGADEEFMAAGRLLGFSDNFLVLLDQERKYKSAQDNWVQYQGWKANRNPKRAEMEAKFGYDGKHALHLVRLMRMGREILTTGEMQVRRPDAQELLSMLQGAWSYDRLVEWAEQQDAELVELAQTSPLPKQPNWVKLDKLCQDITRSMHG